MNKTDQSRSLFYPVLLLLFFAVALGMVFYDYTINRPAQQAGSETNATLGIATNGTGNGLPHPPAGNATERQDSSSQPVPESPQEAPVPSIPPLQTALQNITQGHKQDMLDGTALRLQEDAGTGSSTLKYSNAKTEDGHIASGKAVPLADAFDARLAPGREDPHIQAGFVTSLAHLFVDHYWPAGKHPSARLKGASTLTLRTANTKYGATMTGLRGFSGNLEQTRERFFNYAFTPSMIQRLYSMYAESFIAAMTRYALEDRPHSSGHQAALSAADAADMFALYSSKLAALAGGCTAFVKTDNIPTLLAAYETAKDNVLKANMDYIATIEKDPENQELITQLNDRYLTALVKRDQSRSDVASAMRMHGKTRGMDTDSRLYLAQWLTRRGPGAAPAIQELASILTDCARRFAGQEVVLLQHTSKKRSTTAHEPAEAGEALHLPDSPQKHLGLSGNATQQPAHVPVKPAEHLPELQPTPAPERQ